MIAIWIGIPTFLFAMVLIFALVMCRAAAQTDQEFERARIAVQKTWLYTAETVESDQEIHVSRAQKVHLPSGSPAYIQRR